MSNMDPRQDQVLVHVNYEDVTIAHYDVAVAPDVGEVLTIKKFATYHQANIESEVDYVVYRRRWILTQRPTSKGGHIHIARMGIILDVYQACDTAPTYVCGECGTRWHTEEGIERHCQAFGHDGTSWTRTPGHPVGDRRGRRRPQLLVKGND